MDTALSPQTKKLRLSGKVAVVTASTSGIGFAIAKRLAEEGANLVVCSRNEKNVNSCVENLQSRGFRVTGVVCHVARHEDREKLFQEVVDKFGGFDILVSNAGVNPVMCPIDECPEDAWDKIFEVNIKSAFLLIKQAVPYLKMRGKGSIVLMSSIAAYHPYMVKLVGPYAVSKTTLLGLTKCLALELSAYSIRVNCVAPGVIDTQFSNVIFGDDRVREFVMRGIPVKRFAGPDEVSGIVAFLCSDDSTYITGETVVAAGGIHSRL